MAPTETLAEQHFATLQTLMPGELVQAALLTGSTPAARRADLLGKLATGELRLLVGTHALIEDGGRVRPPRASAWSTSSTASASTSAARSTARRRPGSRPHVLHMTATPIPRTLALTAYGDLDVTVLRELPAGPAADRRRYVAASERERARAYERIREELRAGRQAFVVCPLVEESEALQARAATAEFERLRGGRARATSASCSCTARCARARSRRRWRRSPRGGADVLVATTVIEVGIDVPNATVMLVEDAERYGISQLHQLRGRIGRGEHASVCLLFGAQGVRRGCARWPTHRDGFKLAEIDLELRGEGEMLGTRQSRARRSSGSRGCPRTPSCSSAPAMRARRCSTRTPSCARPSTR